MATTPPATVLVESREATWQLEAEETIYPVRIPYATNDPASDMMLTTGWGETDVAGIAKGLGERGVKAAVCNIVYPPDVKLTPEIIEQVILKGTTAVIGDMNIRAGRSETEPVTGVGFSKGSGEQIKAAHANPGLWRQLIAFAPLGINNKYLGSEPKQQRRTLTQRIQDAGLLKISGNATESGLNVFREFRTGLEYALSQDVVGMVRDLRGRGLLGQIFIGEEDTVFPPEECEEALGIDGFISRVKKAGHAALSTPEGLDQMVKVIRAGMADETTCQVVK